MATWKLSAQISATGRYHISDELAASRFRTEKLGFLIWVRYTHQFSVRDYVTLLVLKEVSMKDITA
jgi:hypothetical protein